MLIWRYRLFLFYDVSLKTKSSEIEGLSLEWLPFTSQATLLENIAGEPRKPRKPWLEMINALRFSILIFWQGYIPPTFQRHQETLLRKRAEYHSFSAEYFESNRVMNADELDILDQIQIDIPRTDSLRNLLHDERIKMWVFCASNIRLCRASTSLSPLRVIYLFLRAIERVLFIRAIRNPATSYVQGMTDLVTPFFSGAKTSQNNYEGTFVLQQCLFNFHSVLIWNPERKKSNESKRWDIAR